MSNLLIAAGFCFAAVVSAGLTWLTILVAFRWRIGWDESHGVQKFHQHEVARLGGVPVFMTLFAILLAAAFLDWVPVEMATRLIVCMLPAFAIGLYEDLTRRAGISSRLLVTMVGAALAFWLLDARLTRLDIPGVDHLLATVPAAALLLTVIAVGGVAHAVNIIDGYNGLSGFFSLAAFAALGFISAEAGDSMLATTALLCGGAVLGFLIWNFPFGKIFLGDAGAYLIGFLLALISVLLVHRNPEVSAWAPLIVVIYPVWETLFSMLRRMRHGFSHVAKPDALHLHHLVHRRLVRIFSGSAEPRHAVLQNSFTTAYLFVFIVLSMVPAVLWLQNAEVLMLCALLYIVAYRLAYRRIVHFKIPGWLVAGVDTRRRD